MAAQGGDAVVPAALVHVLPAQVVHVPVIRRVLLHAQLQQGQVLPPGLGRVRVVVQLDPLRRHLDPGASPAGPLEDLVDRVDPAPAPAGVDLLRPEHHALAAVRVEAPGVAVGGLGRAGAPGLLQGGAPSRVEDLVQIGAYADIRVLRRQLQGPVPGRVKAPGHNGLLRHQRPPVPKPPDALIGGAGVQHHHLIRLRHGVHPPLHKLLLVFADGVDDDLHSNPPP